MPKKVKKTAKRTKKKTQSIPPWGRSESDLVNDADSLRDYAADVPLGNTDPTVVQGKLYGDVPNATRRAQGGLRTYKGKFT